MYLLVGCLIIGQFTHMILDNVEKIKYLIDFIPGLFYYLEILQRKKDNPKLSKDKKVYQRYITKYEDLYDILDDIKFICKVYNARAYISLNARSEEKFTKECLKAITDKVCSNDFKNTFLIPDKIALLPQIVLRDKSMWILDVDVKDENYINEFKECINEKLVDVFDILNTYNGYHVVTDTFNLRHEGLVDLKDDNYKFDKFEFTLRKEALTILYADIN